MKHSELTYLIGMGNGSNYLLIFPTYKSYFQDLFLRGGGRFENLFRTLNSLSPVPESDIFEAEKKSIERQFLLYLNFLVHV